MRPAHALRASADCVALRCVASFPSRCGASRSLAPGVLLLTPPLSSLQYMNRSKELWGPTADEFDPERWRNVPEQAKAAGFPLHLLTFIEGPRGCVGNRFGASRRGRVPADDAHTAAQPSRSSRHCWPACCSSCASSTSRAGRWSRSRASWCAAASRDRRSSACRCVDVSLPSAGALERRLNDTHCPPRRCRCALRACR